jgi:lipopolysaccharide transport system ATP-binding protein
MSAIIKVENLSKEYRLGSIGHGLLFKDLQSGWARLRGKEDPNQKVFIDNKKKSENFLALNNVSFEVKQGEVLGIIGRNGAGKSTLLKILSRVTTPTHGSIKIKGRIASLLEVGTGFHPELTGRENIFLNGAILGMNRIEVQKKFDEIVDFSGVEQFIDTPVKRYSSGMYVRLAFAVAAHLEPEILIVDEVLAVGDAEFQKKCLGKMEDVSRRQGRTVLFVSHSLDAIRRICSSGILLSFGKIDQSGNIQSVIASYKKGSSTSDSYASIAKNDRRNRTNGFAQIKQVTALGKTGTKRWHFQSGEDIMFIISWNIKQVTDGLGFYLAILASDSGVILTNFKKVLAKKKISPGTQQRIKLTIKQNPFRTKYYKVYIALADQRFEQFYDVLDENVNLPELEITQKIKDSHLTAGFFNVSTTLEMFEEKTNA